MKWTVRPQQLATAELEAQASPESIFNLCSLRFVLNGLLEAGVPVPALNSPNPSPLRGSLALGPAPPDIYYSWTVLTLKIQMHKQGND